MFPVFKLSPENTQPENMCDIIFKNTKGIYRSNRSSINKISNEGRLASKTVNYDTKTMYQFEPRCNLLRSTLQVKQQVSDAVVRRFLLRKLSRKTFV